MQPSSIQFQHFWIELILGIVMIVVLLDNPLEKGLLGALVLSLAIFASRTIHHGRQLAARRAEQRRARQAEIEKREEERRLKQEALLQAQREAAEKYLA